MVQTIYAIAMVLGFRDALETSFSTFFPAETSKLASVPHAGPLPNYVGLVVLASIMLLALRFFWVPRNLYSHLLLSTRSLDFRMLRMAVVDFPITLVHALLFFCVCEAYVNAEKATASIHSSLAATLITRFVGFYVLLLLLNGIWLRTIAPGSSDKAATKWSMNNLVCGALAAVWLVGARVAHIQSVVFALVACAIFLVNCFVDLSTTSANYILFPEAIAATEQAPPAPDVVAS